MEIDFDNHDEIFQIIERLQDKNPFDDVSQAAQFALGLKLFSEVRLKNRTHLLKLSESLHASFTAVNSM